MERKNYSSLPSNYLTLAQLQQRWLKQHNQNNQSESQDKGKNQEQDQQSPNLQVVAPSNGSASKSRPQKQYVVKTWNDSETHRLTAAVESVTEIGKGDKTRYLDLDGKGKGSKSNKKIRKVNPKSKTEDRKASGEGSGTTAQEKEKASEKGTTESEVKEKEKENGWVKMNEVEERVRVLSINSGNGKQKGRLGKMNKGFGDFRQQRKHQHSKVGVERDEKKMVWVRKDEI